MNIFIVPIFKSEKWNTSDRLVQFHVLDIFLLSVKSTLSQYIKNMTNSDNEFKLVVGHRSRGRVRYKKTGLSSVSEVYNDQRAHGQQLVGKELTSSAAAGMIKGIKKEIKKIKYAQEQLSQLKTLIDSQEGKKIRIVCLGLGSPCRYVGSRHQFALLCLLLDTLSDATIDVYDPVFSETDIDLLKSFQMTPLTVNDEGKIECNDPSVYTIFYMPHCCRSLYANLLISNWDSSQLSNITIIGNSLRNYLLNAFNASARKSTECMRRLEPAMQIIALDTYPLHSDCFSDMCFMNFPKDELNKLKNSVWDSKPPTPTLDHEMAVGST